MGDPKKQRKKYTTPRFPWFKDELKEQLRLLGEYGLRNKRELLRYETILTKYKRIARALLAEPAIERADTERRLLEKLYHLGVVSEGATLEDVLSLSVEDFLERRLQTVAFRQGFGSTLLQVRQLIVHGHIAVGDRVVTVPSYLVSREEESKINYSKSSPLSKPTHPIRAETAAP